MWKAKRKMEVCDFVAVDIETTGVAVTRDKIIEIGAVKIVDGKVVEEFSELIDPGVLIPPLITNLTGITQKDVDGKRNINDVIVVKDCDILDKDKYTASDHVPILLSFNCKKLIK